jgi:Tol biopolymer transport system component
MITGRRPFNADNPAGLMAAILHAEPPPMSLEGKQVPPSLEHLVRQCLVKSPAERWQSAHDLELELRWIRESGLRSQGATSRPSTRRARLGWVTAGAAVLVALGVGTFHLRSRRATPPREIIRFSLGIPEGTTVAEPFWSHPRVSPDGRAVAFTAITAGRRGLWIRPLDGLSPRFLPETEGALAPFWSPDSRSVAFFAEGKLKTVSIAGGLPQSLCDVPAISSCGSWSPTGTTIVFAIGEAPGQDGLYKVPSSGGEPTRMHLRDTIRGEEIEWAFYPHFLPNGRFLFLGKAPNGEHGLYSAWPDREEAVMHPTGRIQSRVEYTSPGYLLGVAENTLLAYRSDADEVSIQEDPVVVAENVSMLGLFSLSDTGVLVYQPTSTSSSRLAWFDRAGMLLDSVGEVADYEDLCLSPDGQRIAVATVDPRSSSTDLWILRLLREAPLRLTSEAESDEFSPVWSPDGGEIAYSWSRDGAPHVFRMRVNDREPELLVPHNGHAQWVCDWSPDGRTIMYLDRDPMTGPDLWTLDLGGDRKPTPWLQTRFIETDAQFSPDGRWIAYASNDTGRYEIYVQPYPGPGEKRRVSAEGGLGPRWRGDLQEIFYVDLNAEPGIVSAPLDPATLEAVEPPRLLFRLETRIRRFDVTPDGQRFLVIHDIGRANQTLVNVVVNWMELVGQ